MESNTNDNQLASLFNHVVNSVKAEMNETNYRNIADTFQQILGSIPSDVNGCQFDASFARSAEKLLQSSLTETVDCDLKIVTHCVTNCFRTLRNLCAVCPANQDILSESSTVIDTTCNVVSHVLETGCPDEESKVLSRCAVQFIGNYSSGKRRNQMEVWQKLQSFFLQLLQTGDQKLQEYTLIVVHICLSDLAGSLDTPQPQDHASWQLIRAVIAYTLEQDSANGLLVVEDCLKMRGFCEQVFRSLESPSRLLVLEVLINTLKRLPEDGPTGDAGETSSDVPAVQNLQFLAADFILQSHLIAQMARNEDMALCTVKELECVCLATAHHSVYGELQDNTKLVKAAVDVLQAVQELGRQGHQVFASAEKAAQHGNVDPDHPVFGLKRDLIRLLGNLAYRHKENQDLIRELEGLPLIMEQTNIDGKNPFITQWSVFALHNLTENNEENQRYLGDLRLQGVANNQSVLEEMGLHADTDGEKVVIKKKKI